MNHNYTTRCRFYTYFFYIESDAFEHVLERVKQAGGKPLSEPHSNTKYEDTENNKTVYIRAPWEA